MCLTPRRAHTVGKDHSFTRLDVLPTYDAPGDGASSNATCKFGGLSRLVAGFGISAVVFGLFALLSGLDLRAPASSRAACSASALAAASPCPLGSELDHILASQPGGLHPTEVEANDEGHRQESYPGQFQEPTGWVDACQSSGVIGQNAVACVAGGGIDVVLATTPRNVGSPSNSRSPNCGTWPAGPSSSSPHSTSLRPPKASTLTS